jgi:hypothetical protein
MLFSIFIGTTFTTIHSESIGPNYNLYIIWNRSMWICHGPFEGQVGRKWIIFYPHTTSKWYVLGVPSEKMKSPTHYNLLFTSAPAMSSWPELKAPANGGTFLDVQNSQGQVNTMCAGTLWRALAAPCITTAAPLLGAWRRPRCGTLRRSRGWTTSASVFS